MPVLERELRLGDLNILDVGNRIQLYGAIYSGMDRVFLVLLPDEHVADLDNDLEILRMDAEEWERFLNQTDVLDIAGPQKSILRKSQRQIDQIIAWKVFQRDGYACRYCGRIVPLTVDHVILWEEGGPNRRR